MDADYYNDISLKIKDTPQAKLHRVVLSTFLYVIAYVAITYIYQYIGGGFAYIMGFEPDVKYFGLYHMPVSPTLWTKWSVLFIYGATPFLVFLIGLGFYYLNKRIREYNTMLKVFSLWAGVHGILLFLSFCVTCAFGTDAYQLPFYYGLAVVTTWLHVDSILVAPMAIGGVVALIGMGLQAVSPFLSLSFSRQLAINYRSRRQFFIEVTVIPWLLGSVIALLVSLPPNADMRDVLINVSRLASFAIVILGMLFRLDHLVGQLQIHSFDVFKRAIWPWALLLLALILFIHPYWVSKAYLLITGN